MYLFVWQQSNHASDESPAEPAQSTSAYSIKLAIKAPFSLATLTLDEMGLIRYTASSTGSTVEPQQDETVIPEARLHDFFALLDATDFSQYDAEYISPSLMDGTTYTLTVTETSNNNASTHMIRCYGFCPDQISAINDMLISLWGKEIMRVGM